MNKKLEKKDLLKMILKKIHMQPGNPKPSVWNVAKEIEKHAGKSCISKTYFSRSSITRWPTLNPDHAQVIADFLGIDVARIKVTNKSEKRKESSFKNCGEDFTLKEKRLCEMTRDFYRCLTKSNCSSV